MPPSPASTPRKAIVLTALSCLAAGAAIFAHLHIKSPFKESVLPPQAVFIHPKSFNVLGPTGNPFRSSSFAESEFFNPTSTQPPFFQVFDSSFLSILGPNATIHEIASNDTFAFAHEAPIYDPVTDQVFFASNAGGPLSNSGFDRNNQVAKISMKEVETLIAEVPVGTAVRATVVKIDLPEMLQMTNGGTGPYQFNLLFINSGRGSHPPNIALVNPVPPYNATVVLDNYYGRQFNSLNDIKIHPSGYIFFTDTIYGYLFNFRSAPRMPNQVYRFDPRTGAVKVVAADFDKPNGIAFSPNGKIAYIADTGSASGFLKQTDQTAPSTIYAFDIDPYTHAFTNRRVFAYADTGIPDGIQQGTLLGKFFTGRLTPNMVFAGSAPALVS
ncbi:hypothetical protein APHAL10511_007938 [Amanita phalloides]|nr:hypothetical protein APHAL10511_007938 [Amanita phalloides]